MQKRIAVEHAGERVDAYLRKALPGLSQRDARTLCERGGVRDERGARRAKGDRTNAGETLTLDLSVLDTRADIERLALERIAAASSMLAHGARWAVLHKPAALPSLGHHYGDTLHFAQVAHDLIEKRAGKSTATLADFGLVHRLDNATSGAALFALDNEALAMLLAARALPRGDPAALFRTYWAIVRGRPTAASVEAPIAHDAGRDDRMVIADGRTPARGGAQAATTHFKTLATSGDDTLLEVSIEGGRRHQIRVHLASIGHPLLGDALYGGAKAARLGLHAVSITFTNPDDSGRHSVVGPPGDDFWALAPGLEIEA